jgi:protein-arginine kinase activator protein McsA
MICDKCGHDRDLHHTIDRDEELQHDKVVCEECGCDSGNQENPMMRN